MGIIGTTKCKEEETSMSLTEITRTFSNEGTREEVRMSVVSVFSQEKPGMGKKENASKYKYYVETLSSGNRVYLQRPANLHNGFDFLICVENQNYAGEGKRKRNYPTHEDILSDLQSKNDKNSKMYFKLYQLIEKIFNCHDVQDIEMKDIWFGLGLPVDHILKVLKWMFIEQDIRYWNYSGRNMLFNKIPKPTFHMG